LMYRSLFGVSFIMFLLAIIFYVISALINDVAKHENSSKMFGGKNQRSRGPTDRPTAKQTILGLL
jgi:Na+-transporting methylmalonyl-CoA/oxaloacetate decarboxylase gamma subunit